ncbi:MAG: hypothetical protein ACTSRW_06980 [Candidatus Helarchaeota archaeon]
MVFFVDPITEPILWNIAALIFLFLGGFFFYKLIKSDKEARPFFSGIMVFLIGWGIVRIIDTIRRYYVGSYYDLLLSNYRLYGLNYILRVVAVGLSWIVIGFFYFMIENSLLEKKSYFTMTYASAMEGTMIVLLLTIAPGVSAQYVLQLILIIVIIFFFIAGFFPAVLFATFAIKKHADRRLPWLLLSLGAALFVFGVAGDNPESMSITIYLSEIFIHYGTPLLAITGSVLMSMGVLQLYSK